MERADKAAPLKKLAKKHIKHMAVAGSIMGLTC